jgi:hypothetical protein
MVAAELAKGTDNAKALALLIELERALAARDNPE